jgi:dTDP-4-dehydrorhamnose 3,5-epimerase
MKLEATPIAGLWLVTREPRGDARGSFARLWCRETFARHGIDMEVAQSNCSHTRRAGTIRGLHYQKPPHGEHKLVMCPAGAVFDVCVDLRPGSPTHLEHYACELSAANHHAVLVPPGVAHGCQALLDDTLLLYYVSVPYHPDSEQGVRFDDPVLGIHWPMAARGVSDKDRGWPLLAVPGSPR